MKIKMCTQTKLLSKSTVIFNWLTTLNSTLVCFFVNSPQFLHCRDRCRLTTYFLAALLYFSIPAMPAPSATQENCMHSCCWKLLKILEMRLQLGYAEKDHSILPTIGLLLFFAHCIINTTLHLKYHTAKRNRLLCQTGWSKGNTMARK